MGRNRERRERERLSVRVKREGEKEKAKRERKRERASVCVEQINLITRKRYRGLKSMLLFYCIYYTQKYIYIHHKVMLHYVTLTYCTIEKHNVVKAIIRY